MALNDGYLEGFYNGCDLCGLMITGSVSFDLHLTPRKISRTDAEQIINS